MNHHSITLGQLPCHTIDMLAEGEQPQLGVLLCHGFGATGTDLVGLGPEILTNNVLLQNKVQFLFPEAPLALDSMGMPGSRAWWHLDLMAINAAMARGELRDLRNDIPDGLVEAREMLMATIEAYRQLTELPVSQLVLGGFSQGSMVATDVALRLTESPAGLTVFSGTLLAEEEWSKLSANRTKMPVLQSHGTEDQILPYCGAEWLRDMLVTNGLNVDFLEFSEGHTIPYEALSKFSKMLVSLCEDC